MLRTLLCVAVALFVCVDVAIAKDKGEKKAAGPVIGTVKAVDAAAGHRNRNRYDEEGSRTGPSRSPIPLRFVINEYDGTPRN